MLRFSVPCLVDGVCCTEELAVVLIDKSLHIAVQLSYIGNELIVRLHQSWQLLLHKQLMHVLVHLKRMAVYRTRVYEGVTSNVSFKETPSRVGRHKGVLRTRSYLGRKGQS